MRVVFMGTSGFAVPSLRALARRHKVVTVFTRPDRPSGRGRRLVAPPVKDEALALNLPVRQPERLDEVEIATVSGFALDVVCVAAYGLILPANILSVPPYGAVNVHASLLPRHRGAAPIERAILGGDEITGVSIMAMEEGLDTGPVARTVEVLVEEHTAETLSAMLSVAGADALLDVLDAVARGTVDWVPQDDTVATYAEKLTKDDVALHPELSLQEALRRVRASSRRVHARLSLLGRSAVITRLEAVDDPVTRGRVVTTGGDLLLGFSDSAARVLALRPESRGEMTGEAFVCGLQGLLGGSWDAPA